MCLGVKGSHENIILKLIWVSAKFFLFEYFLRFSLVKVKDVDLKGYFKSISEINEKGKRRL